jgi:dihydrolipoamide dehydrogenase
MRLHYDAIVIGGGWSGVRCACALAAGGLRVAAAEREPVSAQHPLRATGVDLLRGHGRLAGPCAVEVDGARYTTEHVVLATGSEPVMPPIRGLGDLARVWTSREAAERGSVPRRLLVLGAGTVGVEVAQLVRRLGGEVVLVERAERVLPHEAARLGAALGDILRRDGVELRLGVRVTAARRERDYRLELDDGQTLRGDRLLLAIGRRPRVKGIGLETIRMVPDARGIGVDSRMRAAGNVWAVGDVTGLFPLTDVGSHQARVAAANILGDPCEARYDAPLRMIATRPQAAAIGLTHDVFQASEAAGRLTLLSDGERLTGAHAIGPEAVEGVRQAGLAIRSRVTLDVLAEAIRPVRSFSEVYVPALEALRSRIAGALVPAGEARR